MRRPAYIAALLILLLGCLALIAPAQFAALVAWFQDTPQLYLAAALRFGVGVSFLLAFNTARGRLALFFLGVVMVAGGVATPIIGQGLARPILDAWNTGGHAIVRGWGVAAIVLGGFSLWALAPRAPEVIESE
ncbi:MAG TPA: hypothetical protein VG712_01340 [Gemmatimonadales bacterium]|nr:hypothetical protein [Gemmatimonadales bacterium]